jgi:hypothetical protein
VRPLSFGRVGVEGRKRGVGAHLIHEHKEGAFGLPSRRPSPSRRTSETRLVLPLPQPLFPAEAKTLQPPTNGGLAHALARFRCSRKRRLSLTVAAGRSLTSSSSSLLALSRRSWELFRVSFLQPTYGPGRPSLRSALPKRGLCRRGEQLGLWTSHTVDGGYYFLAQVFGVGSHPSMIASRSISLINAVGIRRRAGPSTPRPFTELSFSTLFSFLAFCLWIKRTRHLQRANEIQFSHLANLA